MVLGTVELEKENTISKLGFNFAGYYYNLKL